MGDVVVPLVVVLSAAQVAVSLEHAHKLLDGHAHHGPVVPGAGPQGGAPETFQTPVEPVQHRQIGLAQPAVAPEALGEQDGAAVLHDVGDHHAVVIQPDVVEVVHGVLEAAPLAVLVEAGLVHVQIAQTTLLGRLAVPEVFGELFHVQVFQLFQIRFFHFPAPSWIFLISTLSIKAWNRVRS